MATPSHPAPPCPSCSPLPPHPRVEEAVDDETPKLTAEPAGPAADRQPAPAGLAAAPVAARAGPGARARHAAMAGPGAGHGRVDARAGTGGDANARRRLLQPAGLARAAALVVRAQERGLRAL
ncbi:hypothetical protein PR202_gb12864 [Eleusine coracana subsp. coracana]|uniref:Uncharacterized protein n=1 Tax=Eleusine coracana subsp. coracana TaxID=191504 RepID=A0AAV5ENU5_ELECO|nr:hypothetical protein PR202_gb12864 [Eleusine coracana subsp. coracana]